MKTSLKYTPKVATLLAAIVLSCPLAVAQNTPLESSKNDEKDLERITISAKGGDAALQAFYSGNFELAEIKFKENEDCALRKERDTRAFFNDVTTSQLNQEISNSVNDVSNFGNANDANDANRIMLESNAAKANNSSTTPLPSKKAVVKESIRENTCEDAAFQIYMKGMSQLKLGRANEAEENFERSVSLSETLYDAHYRLALIKLLRSDNEGAKEHLAAIKRILKRRCTACGVREEIVTMADFIQGALDGKVRLQ
jgi:tetratricopeptide (TPR) repeat protein